MSSLKLLLFIRFIDMARPGRFLPFHREIASSKVFFILKVLTSFYLFSGTLSKSLILPCHLTLVDFDFVLTSQFLST